jgi:catechol 2,3-dioxygenase-like lactoylglutathione lyase family enzyme
MISGLMHVGLSVADLDRSIAFYTGLFGMTLDVRRDFDHALYAQIFALPEARGEVALLSFARGQLELFQFVHPKAEPRREPAVSSLGYSHFCVEVSDVEAEYRRFADAGVKFHCPPLDFFGRAKATYGRDPDGNVFELWQRLGSAPAATRP